VTSVGDSDPSNAELGRRLETVAGDVRELGKRIAVEFEHMNLRIDKYTLIQVHEVVTNDLVRRIEDQRRDFSRQLKDVHEELDGQQVGRRFWVNATLAVLALVVSAVVGVFAIVNKS
jgi:hypothetical protein